MGGRNRLAEVYDELSTFTDGWSSSVERWLAVVVG
jgi:hypothetical protein